jgi:hypothetical protein
MVMVPVSLTGLLMSNSAVNEWCAAADDAHAQITATANTILVT